MRKIKLPQSSSDRMKVVIILLCLLILLAGSLFQLYKGITTIDMPDFGQEKKIVKQLIEKNTSKWKY